MTSRNLKERRRELREQYESDKFWPLTKKQSQRFHRAAANAAEPKTRLTGLQLLYSGMRNGEFCHQRRNWVAEKTHNGEEMLEIRVPRADVCTGGAGPTGKDNADGVNLRSRGETCAKCRRQGRDHWSPKTENGKRKITIKEPDAIDVIKWWFTQHEQIPMMHNAVNQRIARIANKADITRKVTAHDLRDTFATMLVRRGFDQHPIKRIMGHNDPGRLEDYFKFVGKHQQQEFFEKW